MKRIFLLVFAILISALPFALAYPITIQLNGNMVFNTAVYHCSDAACSILGPLYASGLGNSINYNINNEGSGTQYFAVYGYISDRCYVSHSYKNWFDENTVGGPWPYTINFQKQPSCQANINSVSFASVIYDNQTQQITVNAKSPLNLNSAGPQTVSAALQYYYSANVSVAAEIRNQSSYLAYSTTQSTDILWSTSKNYTLTLPLLQAGTYYITVKTNVNDCMCSSSVEQTQQNSFIVLPSQQGGQQNQTNQTNQLPVANFTFFPANPTINQIATFNASSSYDSDGTITSYSWDFGDSATATGIIVQHAYTTAGNFTVNLTVTDSNNSQSSFTRIINAAQNQTQQNQTNQTNQTQPSQPQQNQTSAAINHVGDINKIELRETEPLNAISLCSEKIKFMFGFYNNGEKLKDVYINFKIPELGISTDSERFDIARKEIKYIEFGFAPDKNGIYQSIISIYHRNNAKRIIQNIKIDCKKETLTAPIILLNKSALIALTAEQAQNTQEKGITGNVIRGFIKPNANLFIFALFIFVMAEVIALYFYPKKQ